MATHSSHSTLQRAATCCNTLQHAATHYLLLQTQTAHLPACSELRPICRLEYVAVCRSVSQCVAVRHRPLQRVTLCGTKSCAQNSV